MAMGRSEPVDSRSEGIFGSMPRWLIVLIVVTVGSTLLPYTYLAVTTPEGEVYTGITRPNVPDHQTYFAWANQVRDGKLLVHNLNAIEDHPPMLPNISWVLMGLTARVTGIPSVYLYHAMRIIFGIIYLLLVYAIARQISRDDAFLKIAMVIVCFGTGVGFYVLLFDRSFRPAELWIPEMWAYSSMMGQPHFVLALVGMALTVLGVLVGLRRTGWSATSLAFGGSVLMTHVHPFTAFVVLGALLVFLPIAIARGLRWGPIIWAGAGAIPPLSLLAFYYMTNEFTRKWTANSILISPPPHMTIIGLGIVLILALYGAWKIIRSDNARPELLLMIVWMVVGLSALYAAPISFQRRCFEGLHLPLAMLAAFALATHVMPLLAPHVKAPSRASTWVIALLLVVFLPTQGAYVNMQLTQTNRVPQAWVEAYEWMHENVPEDACVVAPLRASNYGIRYAVRRFYFSHEFETPDWKLKRDIMEPFFDAQTPLAQRKELLAQIPCEYVMFVEEPVAGDAAELGLEPAFSADGAWVYRKHE